MFSRRYQIMTEQWVEARRQARRRRLRIAGYIALALLVIAAGVAAYFQFRPAPPPPNNYVSTIDVSGQDRPYHVHLPPSYDNRTPLPVVMVFHGYGQTPEGIREMTGFDDAADAHDFIVVYPAGFLRVWEVENINLHQADDLEFIEALIERLDEELAIDRSRIYATGFSNGAMFTQRLACMMPGHFAAFAGVGGALPRTLAAGECEPDEPAPMLLVNGTRDPSTRYEGTFDWLESVPDTVDFWVQANGCDAEAAVDDLPDRGDGDSTSVTRLSYGGCEGGADVVLYRIEDGGHQWPGGGMLLERRYGRMTTDLPATEMIWAFFAEHARAE